MQTWPLNKAERALAAKKKQFGRQVLAVQNADQNLANVDEIIFGVVECERKIDYMKIVKQMFQNMTFAQCSM